MSSSFSFSNENEKKEIDEYTKELEKMGKLVLDNLDFIFNYPFFLRINFSTFSKITDFVFTSSNIDLLTGYSQTFPYYISENFSNDDFDLDFIWNAILFLCNNVIDPINIKFLCDSIYQVLIVTKTIEPRLLKVCGLIDDDSIELDFDFTNYLIIPQILITIIDFIDKKDDKTPSISILESIKHATIIKEGITNPNSSFNPHFFINDELKHQFLDLFCQSFTDPLSRNPDYVSSISKFFSNNSKENLNKLFISQKTELLQLIPKIYTANEIYQHDQFRGLLWNHIMKISTSFETIEEFNENDYLSLMKIISIFLKDFSDIFVYDPPISEFIAKVLDKTPQNTTIINLTNIAKLFFLIPFMNQLRIKLIISNLIQQTKIAFHEQNSFPNLDFIKTLNKLTCFPNQNDIYLYIYNSLVQEKTENNLEVTYLLSCLMEYLENSELIQSKYFFSDCMELLQASTEVVDEEDQKNKSKINPEFIQSIVFKSLTNLVKSSIALPSDFFSFIENDIVHFMSNELTPTIYIFKLLKACLSNDYAPDLIMKIIIEIGIPENPQLYKKLFEIYQEIINQFDYSDSINEEMKGAFYQQIENLMNDPIISPNIKAYLLGVIDIAADDNPEFMISFIDACFPITFSAITEYLGEPDCIAFALEYLNDALNMLEEPIQYQEKFAPIFQELLEICNGTKIIPNIEQKDKDRYCRLYARDAVTSSHFLMKNETEKLKQFLFPFDIIQKFIKTNDPMFVSYAISLTASNTDSYTKEEVEFCFKSGSQFSLLSNDSILMNKMLELCKSIINSSYYEQFSQNLINYVESIFCGRFKFFDGYQLYDYLPKDFKIYDTLTAFFQRNNFTFVPHLMYSIDYITSELFPSLSSCLLSLIENEHTVLSDLQYIYTHCIKRIVDEIQNYFITNEEIEDYIIPLVELLYFVIQKGVTDIDINLFLECLYRLWEKKLSKHNELIIEIIFFIIDMGIPSLHIDQKILFSITQMIASFQFDDIDYDEIITMTLNIFNKHIPEYQLEQTFSILYGNLILKQEEEIVNHNIQCMDQVFKAMHELPENMPSLARQLLEYFKEGNVSRYDILQSILFNFQNYEELGMVEQDEDDDKMGGEEEDYD